MFTAALHYYARGYRYPAPACCAAAVTRCGFRLAVGRRRALRTWRCVVCMRDALLLSPRSTAFTCGTKNSDAAVHLDSLAHDTRHYLGRSDIFRTPRLATFV